jgi:hypothetical protein
MMKRQVSTSGSSGELIATRAQNATPRRVAAAGDNVVDLAATVRPKRARIRPEG